KQLVYALNLRFKSRARLEAENLVLRQQVNALIRKLPKRLQLTNSDRLLFDWLYRLFPSILGTIRIVRPETVLDQQSCAPPPGRGIPSIPSNPLMSANSAVTVMRSPSAASWASAARFTNRDRGETPPPTV